MLQEESDDAEAYEEGAVAGVKRKRGVAEATLKRTPFKRKEPMKGRPRSYRIRMIPTKEQTIEPHSIT